MRLRKFQTTFLLTGAVAVGTMLLSCIERNNLWDPYNGCHPSEVDSLQNYFMDEINAVTDSLLGFNDSLKEAGWKRLQTKITTNSDHQYKNDTALRRLDSLQSVNRRIEEQNSLINNCDSMEFKLSIAPVTLYRMQLVDTASLYPPELKSAKESADTLINRARNTCPKQSILTDGYIVSVHGFFSNLRGEWDTLRDSIDRYNTRMIDYNRTINIDSINRLVFIQDSLTMHYNDSLELCRLSWIEDTTEIQHRIDTIKPGETIALGMDSVYIPDALFEGKGSRGVWTIIRGRSPEKTVVSSRRVEIDSSLNIKFIDIVFTAMENNIGARVIDNSDSIYFSNCVFRNNADKGLDVTNCRTVIIDSCVFVHNGESTDSTDENHGGMRLSDSRGGTIVAANILVARNGGFGIEIHQSNVSITRGTISDNSIVGAHYTGKEGTGSLIVKSSIFSFNKGFGIYRNDEQTTQDIFVSSNDGNRFFENDSGPLGGDPNLELNNPPESADPMFVDRANDNYRIGMVSPLFGKGIGYQYP